MLDLLSIKPGLVPELCIGRIQPRGGFVLQSRILLIAEVFVDPRQQFARFEHPRVSLKRRGKLEPGALEVAAIEQDPGAVEMAFGLRDTSGERRNRQRNQNSCDREASQLVKKPYKASHEICFQHPAIKDGTAHDWLREAGLPSPPPEFNSSDFLSSVTTVTI